MTRDGMTTSQLKNELTLDELILKLCDLFDIIDFFDLNGNDSDAIERQTVIEMITESLKHNSVSQSETGIEAQPVEVRISAQLSPRSSVLSSTSTVKTHIVNEQVNTLFDDILKSRGIKKIEPKYPLWKFKITDKEYCDLKQYIGEHIRNPKSDKFEFDRESALYFSEYHRREYDYKDKDASDSGPIPVVFESLGFQKNSDKYDNLKRRFEDAAKCGAERLKTEIYSLSFEGRNHQTTVRNYYVYSLLYNGGLPIKKIIADPKNPTWHKLLCRILESDERIEFDNELTELVRGKIANEIDALKSFCQQLQEAIIMKDYTLLPFYCSNEEDIRYQFFLNQGKSVLNEIKSRNPFQLQWFFDINMHRKIIRPKYVVSGPDSIAFDSDFMKDNPGLKDNQSFTVVTCEDGSDFNSITYYKSAKDYYGEDAFQVESYYKECTNISIRCLELSDKVLVSEELDAYSPQLIRDNNADSYMLSSNRFIGFKDVIVIVPEGWNIDDEKKYNVEEGYTYLDKKAKLIKLPIGIDQQTVVLRDDNGNVKWFSATIPLNKIVVMNVGMMKNVCQNVFFDVKKLNYLLKRPDGTTKHIRSRDLLFCSDRRTNKWTKEPPLGYIYVKSDDDTIYADPVRILNLGNSREDFSLSYSDSNQTMCKIRANWTQGKITCKLAEKKDNHWIVNKEKCDDSLSLIVSKSRCW